MRLDHLLSKDIFGISHKVEIVNVLRSVLKVHTFKTVLLTQAFVANLRRSEVKVAICSLKTG